MGLLSMVVGPVVMQGGGAMEDATGLGIREGTVGKGSHLHSFWWVPSMCNVLLFNSKIVPRLIVL